MKIVIICAVVLFLSGCSQSSMEPMYVTSALKVAECVKMGGTPYNDGVNSWNYGSCHKEVFVPTEVTAMPSPAATDKGHDKEGV